MKKINSARKPEPMPIPLTKSAILYSMGKDSPDQYVFMPDVVLLDEFRTPTPAYIKEAILKLILERKL